MNADELKKLTTESLDHLSAALAEGHSERLRALLKTMAQFHHYSFHNVCLIARQCPDATRVAGFHAWRKLGRFVRKGEKGIAILAPIVGRKEVETEDGDSKRVVGFRAAYVFDVAQTDGEPLPEPAEADGDPGAATERLKAAIASSGIAVEYAQELDGAMGTSSGGRIQVLAGLQPASEFMVLAHEFAHELLHHRDDRPASRDTRELEAEAVAFVVGHGLGLDVTDTARDYIHLYRGDGQALAESLGRIQQTAATVLSSITIDRHAARHEDQRPAA
jgi:antirestriction protein ArdC